VQSGKTLSRLISSAVNALWKGSARRPRAAVLHDPVISQKRYPGLDSPSYEPGRRETVAHHR
jgi:hypothetical protein